MMRLIVTISTTRFSDLKQRWKNEHSAGGCSQGHHQQTRLSLPQGLVLTVDLQKGRIDNLFVLDRPFGIVELEGSIAIIQFNQIAIFNQKWQQISVIQNDLFNCLHSGIIFDGGLLVAAAGIDSLLHIRPSGQVQIVWTDRCRALNTNIDHRNRYYPTSRQTTHINSVASFDEDSFLATFFHQGIVAKIPKNNTGYIPIVAGLAYPHALSRLSDDCWLVADTASGRILEFNAEGNITKEIKLRNVEWIQDAKKLSDDSYLVCDANASRIIVINSNGRELTTWPYHPEWKVYEAKPIRF